MILKSLILENYCLFAGPHTFDLEPRIKYGSVRPIILFGGKNGAGKTTFLGAIQLAFYGRQSVGERLTEKEYHLALRNRIHRNNQTDRRASFARVGLSFDLVTQGEKNEYYIERSWETDGDAGLKEHFKVQRNGKDMDDVSNDHLQSFVADIVPERLSQLFFFDGEKIKNIAEDITSNAAISQAIQTLLGLDMVKSLQTDLSIFRSRMLKNADPNAYDKEMAAVEADLARLNAEKERLIAEDRHQQTLVDGIKSEISRLEKQLSQQGGNFAQARNQNVNLASELEARLEGFEAEVRELCDTALPFALCPNLSRRLTSELEAETKQRKYRVLDDEIARLQGILIGAAGENFDRTNGKKIAEFLEQELIRYRNSRRPASLAPEIHSLSERDATLTVEFLKNQAPQAAQRIQSLLAELGDVDRELRLVKKDLEKSPEQLALQDAFTELNLRNQDLGRTEEVKRKVAEQLRQVGIDLATKQREKEKIESRLAEATDVAQKTALIQKLNTAIAAYMSRLTQAKIAQLQSEVTECYNRLARKSDFVRRVEINPETFAVAVIDKFGRSVPKEDLSSGEKQIFAISMLWGLARTSGRPLPVVIDTPLGRLDSDHRKNLICNYFPHAGHQVILLSTDTEVDVNLFKDLSPAVSHCYHLKYDQKEARTTADLEYFWRETAAV
jgi:DNA sulfur modification protein DndD